MKPNLGRILVYVLVLFGSMSAPVLGGIFFLNPVPEWLEPFLAAHLAFVGVGLVVFCLLWSYFLCRGASWAAQVVPSPQLQPVTELELRRRLLAINDLDLPFQVRAENDGRIIAEWRIVDAKWAGILEAGGLKMAHQICLEIDAQAHKVRSQDRSQAISWNAGLAGLGGSFSWFRGIVLFEYQSGVLVGLFFPRRPMDGWTGIFLPFHPFGNEKPAHRSNRRQRLDVRPGHHLLALVGRIRRKESPMAVDVNGHQ